MICDVISYKFDCIHPKSYHFYDLINSIECQWSGNAVPDLPLSGPWARLNPGPSVLKLMRAVSLTAWGPGARSRAGPGTGGPEGEAYGSYRILWHFKCKNHCLDLFNIMKMFGVIVSFFLFALMISGPLDLGPW